MMETILQLVVVFGAVAIGARYKGMGLGIFGGLGLLILVVGFGIKPTSAPIDVMLILLAVVTASSVMYSAGGVDWMVRVAERIIRANPKRVTFVAPLTMWFFAMLAGTGHISYPLMPVIFEAAYNNGIRPERAMTVANVASIHAITASPVSAATAAMLGLYAAHGYDVNLGKILAVTVPAALVGIFCASCVMYKKGKELKDDPEYLERLKAGLVNVPKTVERAALPKSAAISAWIFIIGVCIVVLSGFFPALRTPLGATKPISMAMFLQIFMLGIAGVILLVTKAKLNDAINSPIMKAGVTAMIAVFGVAWLGDSFIAAHKAAWLATSKDFIQAHAWLFAVFLFFMASMLASQAATIRAIMPLGLALGLPPGVLTGMLPSVNSTFFFPTSGTLIATIGFDQTGTCKIGKYVLNHSFMLPGLVMTVCAVATGLVIQSFVF